MVLHLEEVLVEYRLPWLSMRWSIGVKAWGSCPGRRSGGRAVTPRWSML